MKFGVMSNPDIEKATELAREVIDFLKDKADITLEESLASRLGREGVPLTEMKSDILITIGGDGTVLWALQRTNLKLFCINAGVLGFLTEASPENAIESLNKILKGEYILDKRTRLKTVLNGERLFDCTNEAVIHTAHVAKMRHFEILVDDNLVADIRADGIIVATPTGSTCYAMSVGSPLVDPRVNAFVIAPIAPFKLSARPYVVPINSDITIKLLEPKRPCILVLDGQYERQLQNEAAVTFTASENPAELVRFTRDFYKRVSEKLIL
ncbi:MAG: NAD(+)/NADH kinase [Methanomassiliicoccales archaeon]|nr:MAG: NAD(+)/NADH kinase [Methanomassiliicoccales archaeon]